MLEFLDYPRQALYNAVEGIGDGDWKKALPGLIGAGVAAPLMATGIGAPLGILAGSAAGGLAQGMFGKEAKSSNDLVRALGVEPETTGGKLASFAANVATDPLSYAGVGMAGKAFKGAEAATGAASRLEKYANAARGIGGAAEAAAPESRLGSLLANRRGFTTAEISPEAGEITKAVGGASDNTLARAGGEFMDIAASDPGMMARYDPLTKTAMYPVGAPEVAKRHEMLHGIVDSAAEAMSKGQNPGSLPWLTQKAAEARAPLYDLSTDPTGWQRAKALFLDELNAHAGESRGLPGQLSGAARFLFNLPGNANARQFYASQLGELSPAAGYLYRGLGYAPHAAVGAGAAGGGGYALSRVLGRD
jgi:hypothetical protein